MPRCHALSKQSGGQCRKPAMRGHTVCAMHGGKSRIGMASGTYKHGRYSRCLPVQLQARYTQARTNKDLLSVRDEIAVCEARLADLFTRVETGESGATWQALRTMLDAFRVAMQAGDVPAMRRHFATMRDLVTRGSDDAQAWWDIQHL